MHYFIIQTTKMMILWMRQKYVKNGIIKSKTLHLHTGCPKKNVVSWKNGHNYLQNHPKYKSWGCFGKFRIFATR